MATAVCRVTMRYTQFSATKSASTVALKTHTSRVLARAILARQGIYDSTSVDPSSSNTVGLKVGVSFAVLIAALLIASIVAKLVNTCINRRQTVSDNESDISDNTRDLIQTRLALIRMKQWNFGPKGPNIREMFLRWKEKVTNKLKTKERATVIKHKPPNNTKLVLAVEQTTVNVDENQNGVKSSKLSPRSPIFSGAQNGERASPSRRALAKLPGENTSPTRSNIVPGKDKSDTLPSSLVEISVHSSQNKQTIHRKQTNETLEVSEPSVISS